MKSLLLERRLALSGASELTSNWNLTRSWPLHRGLFHMQKVFNLMAVSAFVMSGTMVAGTVVFYSRIPSLTKKYISDLKTELTKAVLDQVPVPEIPEMPKLPKATGPAIPLP